MEYSIDRLAKMAGVTSRTLRYYHQIGLLEPVRTSAAGYRIYGAAQVDRLQQILFFRALGIELEEIGRILSTPGFDYTQALRQHLKGLEERRSQLNTLIDTVKKTIENREGMTPMTDSEKFRGFKKDLIEENEAKYGREIREKYGEEAVAQSNAKMMNLTQEQYDAMEKLAADIQAGLARAVENGLDPAGEEGQRLADLHRQWLGFTWPKYSAQAHRGLCDMYLADSRFTQYYDSKTPGCAAFLRDAVYQHAK